MRQLRAKDLRTSRFIVLKSGLAIGTLDANMSSNPSERLGEILHGTYRLERLLGRGGMGEVYETAHLRLVRRFAVKVLKGPIAEAKELERFRQEAQITSALGHPHIVEVIDFNELEDGSAYIVMELLEGENLADRLLKEKRLDLRQAAAILRQTAGALEVAHAKGVIHRDLKPANIFLCNRENRDDYVKVVDFGISKVLGAKVALTKTSEIIGTPHYMAPEQIMGEGKAVDHRADVYAMATITFEMLTGRTPFSADSVPALLYRILDFPAPNALEFNSDIPKGIGRVLQTAMQKEPGSRYDSIRKFWHAFVEELRKCENGWDSQTGNQGAAAAAMKITMGPLLSPSVPPLMPAQQIPLTDQDLVPPSQRPASQKLPANSGKRRSQAAEAPTLVPDSLAHDETQVSGQHPTLATNSLPQPMPDKAKLSELGITEPPLTAVPLTLQAGDDLISLRLKRGGAFGNKSLLLILLTVVAVAAASVIYLRGRPQSAASPPAAADLGSRAQRDLPAVRVDALAQTPPKDAGPKPAIPQGADLGIAAGKDLRIALKRPKPKRPPAVKIGKIRTATLRVSSRYGGKMVPAYIYLDGKRIGESPLYKPELKPGTYRLLVKSTGYKPALKTVILAPGKTLTTVIDLQKE